MHRSLYNDSQTLQFHMLFPYQNNLKKYYYSEDLKRKTPIVLIVVYCVNFDLCPTFRLCLKRVKQRYICERYVFGCQLCVRWPSSRQSFVRKSKPPYSITSPVTALWAPPLVCRNTYIQLQKSSRFVDSSLCWGGPALKSITVGSKRSLPH